MPLATKIAALFAAMQPAELDQLPPAERERFGQVCRHWAELAERRGRDKPKSGVLEALRYARGHE